MSQASAFAFLVLFGPPLALVAWVAVITIRHRRRMREIERLRDWRNHIRGAKP